MSQPYAAPFAAVTEALQAQLDRLPRCAEKLYFWLRRMGRPGRAIEFKLDQFIEQYDYSKKWAKQALTLLIEAGLLVQELRSWGYWFRVVLVDPGIANDPEENKPSDQEKQTSQTQPSNAEDTRTLLKGSAKTTNTTDSGSCSPTASQLNPKTREEGSSLSVEPSPSLEAAGTFQRIGNDPFSAPGQNAVENEISRIEQLIGAAPRFLRRLIQQTPLPVIMDAIASLEEAQTEKRVNRSPIGFLVQAIREQWKPNNSAQLEIDAFSRWRQIADQRGWIERWTSSDSSITGLPSGTIGVMRKGGDHWEDWRTIARELTTS